MNNDPIGHALGDIFRRRKLEKDAMVHFTDEDLVMVEPRILKQIWTACIVQGDPGPVVLQFKQRRK